MIKNYFLLFILFWSLIACQSKPNVKGNWYYANGGEYNELYINDNKIIYFLDNSFKGELKYSIIDENFYLFEDELMLDSTKILFKIDQIYKDSIKIKMNQKVLFLKKLELTYNPFRLKNSKLPNDSFRVRQEKFRGYHNDIGYDSGLVVPLKDLEVIDIN
jgi:hypothetical protein